MTRILVLVANGQLARNTIPFLLRAQKGEAFRGHDVSLNSLSDLITRLATTP